VGYLPIVNKWGPVEKATISYGYGLSVTPLQLAQGYAAIANDGRLRAPTFVKGALNPDNAVIDPQIAHTILQMLETVVMPGGTAFPQAVVRNYLVAGKTGTARIAHAGGYQNRYISLFVGIVPASDPKLVGVVVVNDPGGGQGGAYYGGTVSAPVFAKVMDGALRLLDVPPDNVQNWYAGTSAAGVPPAPAPASAGDDNAEEAVP
jgi:cell division protein FtsI (penicillin-binding protein 3)